MRRVGCILVEIRYVRIQVWFGLRYILFGSLCIQIMVFFSMAMMQFFLLFFNQMYGQRQTRILATTPDNNNNEEDDDSDNYYFLSNIKIGHIEQNNQTIYRL